MKKYTLAVLGCGNMAQAIIRAVSRNAALDPPPRIIVSDIDPQKLDETEPSVIKTTDNAFAVREADYVLLAVKPQVAEDLLRPLDLTNKVVLSIMAGTSIDTLQRLTGSRKIVRIMPNLNARIALSYNAYDSRGLSPKEQADVLGILASFGEAANIDESMLDAVTGLTGSSPAFVFMLIKAFAEKGVALGFPPDTARQMALSAVIGSAELVKSQPKADISKLIDSVCSKGGTTIEGVRYLQSKDFEPTVQTAIEKAVIRAKELSAQK